MKEIIILLLGISFQAVRGIFAVMLLGHKVYFCLPGHVFGHVRNAFQ